MHDLEVVLRGFCDELKTAALSPPMHGAISGAGAMGGIGAAIGGLRGAYGAYQQARAQGVAPGEAALGSVGSAAKGALIGGGIGALAGAGLGRAMPEFGAQLTKAPVIGAPARFAQRQVHGLTGWTPIEGIESIRGGAWAAKQNLESARAAVPRAQQAVESAQAAQEAGLTNLPGYLKALRADPKGTILKGFREQWHGSGPGAKALTVGLPAVEALHAVTSEEGPTGPGKAERIGRGALPAAVGAVSGQLPLAAQLLVGSAAGAVGAGAGRAVDRLRGRRPAPYKEEPPTGPVEVRATPEAMMGAGGGSTSSSEVPT